MCGDFLKKQMVEELRFVLFLEKEDEQTNRYGSKINIQTLRH